MYAISLIDAFSNSYDLVMTVDEKHKTDTYHSSVWVNSEGKLMEKPIVYEGDSAVIGRIYGFLWSNFDPMLELPVNGSAPAHELFQELFEPSLN